MSLKNIGFMALAAAVTLTANAQCAEKTVRVITGFQHPESVLIVGDRRFISNIGARLEPLAHDGDGFISEVDANGALIALRAFPLPEERLDAPKGMGMFKNRLYVADIDRIIGFDLATRKKVFEARSPEIGPVFLNDIDAMGDDLTVSDTVQGKIYRVNLDNGSFTTIAEGIPGANGLAWDAKGKRLLVAGLGAKFDGGDIFEIPVGKTARKLEKSPHGIFDGLALLPDDRMLLSDWRSIAPPTDGSVSLHHVDGSIVRRLDFGRDIRGPADFAVDKIKSELWIPATLEASVVIVSFTP